MTNFNTKEEISLGKNYKLFLNKKLGNGAFGDLYRGENISTKKPIAIKCEKVKEDHLSLLKTEKALKEGHHPLTPNMPHNLKCGSTLSGDELHSQKIF